MILKIGYNMNNNIVGTNLIINLYFFFQIIVKLLLSENIMGLSILSRRRKNNLFNKRDKKS